MPRMRLGRNADIYVNENAQLLISLSICSGARSSFYPSYIRKQVVQDGKRTKAAERSLEGWHCLSTSLVANPTYAVVRRMAT